MCVAFHSFLAFSLRCLRGKFPLTVRTHTSGKSCCQFCFSLFGRFNSRPARKEIRFFPCSFHSELPRKVFLAHARFFGRRPPPFRLREVGPWIRFQMIVRLPSTDGADFCGRTPGHRRATVSVSEAPVPAAADPRAERKDTALPLFIHSAVRMSHLTPRIQRRNASARPARF